MLWFSMSLSNKANGEIPWSAAAVQATTVESTVSKPIVETGLLCLPQLQHPLAVILTMTYESNDKGNPPRASPRSGLVKLNRRVDTCKQQIWQANLTEFGELACIGPSMRSRIRRKGASKHEFNGRGFSSNRN